MQSNKEILKALKLFYRIVPENIYINNLIFADLIKQNYTLLNPIVLKYYNLILTTEGKYFRSGNNIKFKTLH